MVNVKALIRQELLEVDGVNAVLQTYPKTLTEVPIIIFRTTRRPNFITAMKEEILTDWRIELEIISKGDPECIAKEVQAKLTELGFEGNFSDSNLSDYNRMTATFRGIVDNKSYRIYT